MIKAIPFNPFFVSSLVWNLAHGMGGVLVPLNFRLAKPELASILGHAEAGILIVDPDFYPTGEALSRDLPLVKMVGLRDAPKGWFAWDGPLPAGFDPESVRLTVNRWILGELSLAAQAVDAALEGFRFNDAAGAAYQFVWGTFCD